MELVVYLIFAVLLVVPAWKIVGRSGMHPAFSLLFLIPLVGLIFLWVLAFRKWPGDEGSE
ncbi:hypothetical protein [Amaricoccus tamworthensis]|uniref:hypothetical protein n=1 Tax=Amaricoccus tamworthensis TaxID=57002 RepID=UPI003C79D889